MLLVFVENDFLRSKLRYNIWIFRYFSYMGELRPYCTVASRTRKLLYLSFYSTDFQIFFCILVGTYSTYRTITKSFGCVGIEIIKWQRSKTVRSGTIQRRKWLSLPPNFDWTNIVFYNHFVEKFLLSNDINLERLWYRFINQILQTLSEDTLQSFYVPTD